MDTYLIPIKTAILVFFGLINIIAIPILLWEYHKKGALTLFKAIIIYSFIFYLITAFFLTLLPLPSREFVASLTGPFAQLTPFMFIKDIFDKSTLELLNPKTYFGALTQPVLLQVIFNIILTIPFGVYLRYYFKLDFKKVILFTFLMSLFYEITQITGVYGIYSRPYRLFDVDDLMLNTFGGLIGYLVTPAIVFMFPTRDEIEAKVEKEAIKVPFLRRVFAYLIDYNIIFFVFRIINIRLNINEYIIETLIALILGLIYFFFNGKTFGLWLMRLQITSDNNQRLALIQSLVRSFIFMLVYNLVFKISMDFFNFLNNNELEHAYILAFYIILMFASQLVLIGHVIYNAIIKREPLFYEKLSNTYIKSTLKK